MKRNEAVYEINKILHESASTGFEDDHPFRQMITAGYDGDIYLNDKLGELILGRLESMGMKPPGSVNVIDGLVRFGNKWENEWKITNCII